MNPKEVVILSLIHSVVGEPRNNNLYQGFNKKKTCDFVTYSLKVEASDTHSHKTTESINDS